VSSLRSRHRNGLAAATVRVLTLDSRGSTVSNGTGFFVAPGRVVTCAHVVPGQPGHEYFVESDGDRYPATVPVRDPQEGAGALYSYPDVALLTVDAKELAGHPCAPLGTDIPESGRDLYSFGCPLLGNGEPFWDHVDLVSEGKRVRASNSEVFLKTKGGQVQPGASGSGVIDVDTGEVVGMLVQTRDARLDLGGVAVPTAVILDRLAAQGHDVAEENRAAVQKIDTLAAARRRFGMALQILVNELTHAKPAHWQSMLMAIDRATVGPLTADEVAMALLHLELSDLGTALRELAHAAHDARLARDVLAGAVPFACFAGRPWVEQDTARRLADERESPQPRAVHLPACKQSVLVHAVRAAVSRRCEVLDLSAPSGASVDGLPPELVRAVKFHLLDMLGEPVDDANDAEAVETAWAEWGTDAVGDHGRDLLVVLPAGITDLAAVDALRRTFSPCVFVIADRTLSAALRDRGDVLALRPSLSAEAEAKAERRFGNISNQIVRAAG
jgi:hypothetical protein